MSPTTAAVLFDFAGTLFSDRALRDVHLVQLRFVADRAGLRATDEQLRAAYRRGMGVAARTVGSGPAYLHRTLFGAAFTAMAGALGGEIDEVTAQAAVDRQYRATLDNAALRPDCLDTLASLRERAVHVQIVSNIDDEQLDPLVARLGLGEVIDAATSSQAAGSCKPDPGIYHLALGKAGCAPAQALFVGDSLRHDVEGPAAVGIRTAWLTIDAQRGPGDVRPDHVIGALAEVPALVRQGASA